MSLLKDWTPKAKSKGLFQHVDSTLTLGFMAYIKWIYFWIFMVDISLSMWLMNQRSHTITGVNGSNPRGATEWWIHVDPTKRRCFLHPYSCEHVPWLC